jgi:hypothetical protein
MIRAALGVLKWLSPQLLDLPFENVMVMHFFLIFFSKVAFAAVARLALRKRHGHAFIMC